MSTKRVVILTGVNRGLGKKTAELLLSKNLPGFHYIFTQRSGNHGDLRAALSRINPAASFELQQLELTDASSRSSFFKEISSKHKTIDVLYNNAGYYDTVNDNGKQLTSSLAEKTLDVNFKSAVELAEQIFPILSDDGRIIQTSSILAQLRHQPKQGQEILKDETLTKDRLYKLSDNYIAAAGDPSKDLVFSKEVYHFSKALLTAYVRFVATKYIKPNQTVLSVHPGWVQTDMGGPNATLTVDQACPHLATTTAELPFGRHEFNGKLIFENKLLRF